MISLQLKRGDSLYYRSGPAGGGQSLLIESEKPFVEILPVAKEWVVLEFSDPSLPDLFTVKFRDGGAGWGEWSAIAIRK